MVDRWRQLPFDHALSRMPAVRAPARPPGRQLLRSRCTRVRRISGPGVVMDQLTVLVYDLAVQSAAPQNVASCATPSASGAGAIDLAHELATLRRRLG